MKKLLSVLLVILSLNMAACADNTSEQINSDIKQDISTSTENIDVSLSSVEESSGEIVNYDAGKNNYTKYTEYTALQASPRDLVKGNNDKVLVAYFSRSGNTAITDDIDAISSASLLIRENGNTVGTCESIAEWIAEETGGDLFLIQTEYTYPVDYDQLVEVGEGQDIDGYHPSLCSHLEDIEQYDTVYLVYPIWHYTISVPTCSFLDEYDLSGKTIYAFAANEGSRFADSIERIAEAEPEATVLEGISVNQRQLYDTESTVRNFVKEHMK